MGPNLEKMRKDCRPFLFKKVKVAQGESGNSFFTTLMSGIRGPAPEYKPSFVTSSGYVCTFLRVGESPDQFRITHIEIVDPPIPLG